MQKRSLRRLLTWIIGGSIFVWSVRYLATAFDWAAILVILRQADPRWLSLAGLTILVHFLIRTLRWYLMLRKVNPDVPFLDLYFVTAVSLALSLMTPGQSGELIKVELLRNRGLIGRLPGYGSFLVERLADLVVVTSLGVVGLLSGAQGLNGWSHLLHALVATVVVVVLAILAFWRLHPVGRLGAWIDRLRSSAGDGTTLINVFALTLLSWANVAVAWLLCLRSVGVSVSLEQALTLVAIITLGGLLSLVPGALGVAEVLTAVVLHQIGIAAPPAQTGALVLRCYGLMLILVGALHLLIWRLLRPVAWNSEPRDAPPAILQSRVTTGFDGQG
jgi:uncharacterized membrane protein YbhN (UPF0104 family)